MFERLYYLLLLSSHIVATPFLMLFSLKKRYRYSIPARFFLFKNPPLSKNGIWFHSCSFGEAKAISNIVKMFDKELVRATSTTQTGFRVISEMGLESRYLPFETLLPLWIEPQKVLVVAEAELWYLLFALTKRRGAYTVLINARISTNSYHKYRRFRWFYKRVFANIDRVYAQTFEDEERLRNIGAKNVEVVGNIKLVNIGKATKEYKDRVDSSPVVVAGSTHRGEERLILDSFLNLKLNQKGAKLIVVPRHPERFDEVAKLIRDFIKKRSRDLNLSFSIFGRDKSLKSDIVLVDMMGELVNFYKICDVAILGGSFEPIGGHNFAEVAQFGSKIITGKYIFNQRDILNSVEGVVIVERENLSETLLRYRKLPDSSLKIKRVNVERIVEDIKSVL